jgi:dTDP-4-amino-4,6-dideoxygalactose transaminase
MGLGTQASKKALILTVHIPFVNLRLQYETIRSEIDQAIQSVFENSQFIGGDIVRSFESDFARYYSGTQCISTGNGTDALFIILKALNIGPGDEVITSAFGCIPSAEIISLTGARVVFCDVDDQHYTLDPNDVESKITPKTKAVIAVHLFGQAAPVERLKKICDNHTIHLIEDCAQAHRTLDNEIPVGTLGIASAFSFYPTKNLGAYGDAGCILTASLELAEKMRRLTNHGALLKHDHILEGMNSRMDTLQAAILTVKLKHLDHWNSRRREIASLYRNELAAIDTLILPVERESTTHTYHIFCMRTPYRDSLMKYLATHGIQTMIHYPEGLPFTQAYAELHHTESDFPVTAMLQNQVLSLPVYPELTNDDIHYIGKTVRQYFNVS